MRSYKIKNPASSPDFLGICRFSAKADCFAIYDDPYSLTGRILWRRNFIIYPKIPEKPFCRTAARFCGKRTLSRRSSSGSCDIWQKGICRLKSRCGLKRDGKFINLNVRNRFIRRHGAMKHCSLWAALCAHCTMPARTMCRRTKRGSVRGISESLTECTAFGVTAILHRGIC